MLHTLGKKEEKISFRWILQLYVFVGRKLKFLFYRQNMVFIKFQVNNESLKKQVKIGVSRRFNDQLYGGKFFPAV